MKDPVMTAAANFEALRNNPYPGRVIVVGLVDTFMVQIYAIMGRSENSRNRLFERDGARVYTVPADPSKVKDPSLIFYNAMMEASGVGWKEHVVSNGNQTDVVVKSREGLIPEEDLDMILRGLTYEPDGPNFTSRITAISYREKSGARAHMSILRKSSMSDACDRFQFEYVLHHGFGHLLSTYQHDGDPLPAFRGEPHLVPLFGNAEEVADTYWEALDEKNRVSLAVLFIPLMGESTVVIRNKYRKVAQPIPAASA